MTKRKIIIAITGASGSIYGKLLIDKLGEYPTQFEEISLIFSPKGLEVWQYEIGAFPNIKPPFKQYLPSDFFAPCASGSAGFDTMIICPCSMGTIGRIAAGISNDLITRSADVILKERKKLIIVPRETPFSLIHLNNMKTITEAGGIICPASPSFYSKPVSIEEAVNTVIERVLSLTGIEVNGYKWGE
jgi:4-hydroxy-3-polyprenylbenzoate decarboxylase